MTTPADDPAPEPTTAAPATPPPNPPPGTGTEPARPAGNGGVAARAGEAVERAAAASGRIASTVVDRLRNDAEFTAGRGTTRIEDEVVEKIAGIAARGVPGVHDLGGDTTRFFASVRERVGLGDAERANRGVSVRLDGTRVRVGVTLQVEYGVKVHPLTEAVRAAIISAVEEMLELTVTDVDIVVDDVHVPDRR